MRFVLLFLLSFTTSYAFFTRRELRRMWKWRRQTQDWELQAAHAKFLAASAVMALELIIHDSHYRDNNFQYLRDNELHGFLQVNTKLLAQADDMAAQVKAMLEVDE